MDTKKILIWAVIAVIVVCLLTLLKGHLSSPTPITYRTSPATIAPGFTYEVVTDPAAQEQGLGGRADIADDYGMLFVFPNDQYYGFWMKDMLTPIDMVWLSDNGTIIKIDASVPADSYPKAFYPPQPVRYVLETRAGESQKLSWNIGTQLPIPFTN